MNLLLKLANQIDKLSEWSGRIASLLVLIMALLITYDVTMRYLFQSGSVALQELEWHLFAIIFLLGSAYTLKHDEHVRIDIIYLSRWMSPVRRAYVDLFGSLFLLIPFAVIIIVYTWPFVFNAYQFNETSPDPGGLPYRFAIKSMIIIGFALLVLQGLANAIHNMAIIVSSNKPLKDQ